MIYNQSTIDVNSMQKSGPVFTAKKTFLGYMMEKKKNSIFLTGVFLKRVLLSTIHN